MIEDKTQNVTGTQINYYFICKTKLWLFSHHIQMEHENEDVQIGKLIHDTRYQLSLIHISEPTRPY